MYAFVVDFVDFSRTGRLHLFMIFFIVIWVRWLFVNVPALFYKPIARPFRTSKTVIVPVVNEEPDVFRAVLKSIQKQRPQQTIVVINGPRNVMLERVCKEWSRIQVIWTRKPGKRNAIKRGMKLARNDIILLVDSDTIWEDNLLKEIVKPFADPTVGGVTSRQRISNPTNSLLNRLCDWLEDVRMYGTMQAMSVNNKVGCLPGRTIAFRRSILDNVMKEFMTETFLGFHKEVSDDRSLTNLTLKSGYKTVLQSTAIVHTEAPTSWRVFLRQQLRWAEGSQYNNIKMSPWMLRHAPLMFVIYWTDMLLPFLLWGLFGSFVITLFLPVSHYADPLIHTHNLVVLLMLIFGGAYISYSIRQLSAISERPVHLLFIPFYLLFLSFVMAPLRMVGFAKLADDLGWGTRKSAYRGRPAKRRELLLGEVSHATA